MSEGAGRGLEETIPRPSVVAEDLFRRESGRLVAMLVGKFGTHRLQLAEDVVQEALVRALQTWPYRGVPENPAAWLTQTACNLAVDHVRRERRWSEREEGVVAAQESWFAAAETTGDDSGTFADDTLRMMFVCFHPQLSTEAQVALALRTLCGLSAAEIAAAFLTTEAAIAKRLVRARQRVRELALPFEVPPPGELPARLQGVLTTLYLLFNEGYKASAGDRLVRTELCHEAIRLGLQLAEHTATRQPRTLALIALMLLNGARLGSRVDDAGNLLRLHEQDRSTWNRAMICRGMQYLAFASSGNDVSEYHLQAGIAAVHCLAPDVAGTDWRRILGLYDRLVRLNPSPVVLLNRAVALAEVGGPVEALNALESIPNRGVMDTYHLFHAVRGALWDRLERRADAIQAYRRAHELASLPSEREFIARRIAGGAGDAGNEGRLPPCSSKRVAGT